ncbi:Peptidase family M48 [Palleronia marisminoris]|uniref:TPR repeat-containing protein YfgC n=1 Tax=Palleronia marisminoris TaxID=315423 RepID=A0A1Y5T047_9RHOB|nr:M48 family metallopeptidase [Palleronia marisminoris]SFH12688.1 Peptidase family M48 [Palleronia marisminoris]SLN53137.1 TPR repeat-containing protein YfgC precursor [Palleronia marisminoris]
MCQSCFTRRAFLGASLTAPVALSGCDEAPNLVSDEEAARMGQEAWEQMLETTPLSRNRSYEQALQSVSMRLLNASAVEHDGWEIEVFASPQINAFALPGGKIGVYEGMFDVVQNEAQLAAIVGHEIGHLSAEHAQKRMSAQIARNAGLRIVSFFLNVGGVEYSAEIAAALGLGLDYGLLLPYSRDQEIEADALGLTTMSDAGFNPQEAVTLWQRMQAANANRAPEFLATHPTPASRIREIEEILETI